MGSLGGGQERSGSDGEGVRLAQLRGEQACNTNQGDLVMDRRLDRESFVFVLFVIICEEYDEAVGGATPWLFLRFAVFKEVNRISAVTVSFTFPHIS